MYFEQNWLVVDFVNHRLTTFPDTRVFWAKDELWGKSFNTGQRQVWDRRHGLLWLRFHSMVGSGVDLSQGGDDAWRRWRCRWRWRTSRAAATPAPRPTSSASPSCSGSIPLRPWPCLVPKRFRYCSTFVCLWQILSNYGLTRIKRFVSRFPAKLCS